MQEYFWQHFLMFFLYTFVLETVLKIGEYSSMRGYMNHTYVG